MTCYPRLCLITLGVFFLAGGFAQGGSLKKAIDQVMKMDPKIRAQAYSRLVHDQEKRQAVSGYYPTRDATADSKYPDHSEPTSETLYPNEAKISLKQNVFTGFATKSEINRQEERVRAAAYTVQAVSEQLALEASRVNLNVLRDEELKIIVQKNLDTLKKIMAKILESSDSGAGNRADPKQVEDRLVLAHSNYIVAETNLLYSYSSFLAVIGHLPENLVVPTAPNNTMPATLKEAISLALVSNPTFKAAKAELNARKEQYEVTKSTNYPILDLVVEQTWDDEVSRIEEKRDEFSAHSINSESGLMKSHRNSLSTATDLPMTPPININNRMLDRLCLTQGAAHGIFKYNGFN